jgi:Tol biopolymer transport system component
MVTVALLQNQREDQKMKTIVLTAILVTAFIAADLLPCAAQSPEQLYQKGLMKEEGEGALQDAINMYVKVADNTKAVQSLRAKALLHAGMCYEKLGVKEAVQAYKRLVSSFPSQKNEVAVARERLARLMPVSDMVAEAHPMPQFTRIKIPTRLSPSVILSPDGKALAHIADKKIWITPLTGSVGPDFPGKPFQLNTGEVEVEWTGLAWSHDGKWIAFNENPPSGSSDNDTTGREPVQGIYIVPSAGGEPHKILENYRDARVVNYRISLSPDGKVLAHTSVENKEQHLFLTPVDGGSSKRLVEMQARGPSFSPDGKMIAFVQDKGLGRGEGDLGLWIVPAMGGTPRLLADAGKAGSPVWSPDGSMIAFIDDTKNKQVNIVELQNGQDITGKVNSIDLPEGTGEILMLAGWTPDNKLGLLITSEREFSLFTLPAKGGQAAIISADCYAFQPRWSRDGKQIYYVKPPQEGENRFNRLTVDAVPATGGTGTPLQGEYFGKTVHQLPYMSGNRISPDGKMILTAAYTSADTSGVGEWPNSKIWKISLDGKVAEQITFAKGKISDMCPSWSPDGKRVAFIRTGLKEGTAVYDKTAIYTVNLSGGEPELLIPETDDYVNSSVWSPDGKMIAYTTRNPRKTGPERIGLMKIVDVADGTIRVIGEVPGANVNTELAWSPDSKRIAFNQNNTIVVMDVSDGKTEEVKTGLADTDIWHFDWSADGKQFVFFGMQGGRAEFWFMEDFLPLEKLARKAVTPATRISEDITVRQVWSGPETDDFGSVSANGELLSFTDWETGNLAVRNLKTGENRMVTDDATWTDSVEYAEYSRISPDGKQFAYSWYHKNINYELRLKRSISGKPVTLYSCQGFNEYITPGVWFSDGNRLIAQRSNDKTRAVELLSIDLITGAIEVLKEIPPAIPFMANLALSPDERYLAFDVPKLSDNGMFDINIVSLETGQESHVVEHPANDRLVGWLPGRNELLFVSDRSGTKDMWAVAVSEGKPAGVPRRLLNNTGTVNPMGFTHTGSLVFGVSTTVYESFIVPLNSASGVVSMNERTSLAGQLFGCSWLPDGESMILNEYNQGPAAQASMKLVLMNTVTGKSRILAEDLSFPGYFRISPDGRSVVAYGHDRKRLNDKEYSGGIYLIDIETGIANELNTSRAISGFTSAEWDNEGKNIFYVNRSDVVKHNLESGNEEVIYSAEGVGYTTCLTRSYDGKNLLLDNVSDWTNDIHQLVSVPITGGAADTLATYQSTGNPRLKRIALSPDGKYIYLSTRTPGMKAILSRILSTGGAPENLWQSSYYFLAGISVHPDGKKIALSTFETAREIRLIDNLDKKVSEIFSDKELIQ